jgi:GH24 family phage-related lysozyme (muramidase)
MEVVLMSITKISENGLALIKQFEGCYLKAYYDSVHVITIGYGTTNADKQITGLEIKEGTTITQEQADKFLRDSVDIKYGPKVAKYNKTYNFNQNQFDALVSFAYNIGSIDQLTQNGTRTISEIGEKILAYNKAGGKELPGLTKRRKAEKELFEKGQSKEEQTEKKQPEKVQLDKKVSVTPKKKDSYKGTYTVTAESGLNMRKSPVDGTVIITIKEGEKVTCDGSYEVKNGVVWLYVKYGQKEGYCTIQYLKKYSKPLQGIKKRFLK